MKAFLNQIIQGIKSNVEYVENSDFNKENNENITKY